MLAPIPAQPSKPQPVWIYLIASFLLLYGTSLYFYLHHVWPLGGFTAGAWRHAGYCWQGLRAAFAHDPISAGVWHAYVEFMTRRALWLPLALRAFGAFVLLPFAVGWFLSLFSFRPQNEMHVRGLRYEPDGKKSVRIALQHIATLRRKRERQAD